MTQYREAVDAFWGFYERHRSAINLLAVISYVGLIGYVVYLSTEQGSTENTVDQLGGRIAACNELRAQAARLESITTSCIPYTKAAGIPLEQCPALVAAARNGGDDGESSARSAGGQSDAAGGGRSPGAGNRGDGGAETDPSTDPDLPNPTDPGPGPGPDPGGPDPTPPPSPSPPPSLGDQIGNAGDHLGDQVGNIAHGAGDQVDNAAAGLCPTTQAALGICIR